MSAFLPFSRPTIDEATIAAVADVLRSGWITTGPKVQEFEKKLSEYFGGRTVRTFNSGTCTMEIALRIAGIGAGDEVITSPISWVATANVILEVGATPVFADIDPVTRNIDLDKVEAAITPKTRAIIPVYLAGKPVDMDRLYAIAAKHKLRVVEDAAQAIGSSWKGKPIGSFGGSFGDFVSFSFQANKNITTSEGGCLVLNNEEEAKLAEKYRLQGVTRSGIDGIEVDVLGGKYNMTDVAAAIGLGQFAQLDAITAQRRKLAKRYFEVLGKDFEKQTGAQLPPADFENTNWHLFQIVLPERITRADFMAKMKEHNIGIGYHYAPIHLFKLYRALGFREGLFPVAERVGRQIVSLPMFYAMDESDVERTCKAMCEVLEGNCKL
ncbi:MAG: DegT/DnrJ/EryC1/StrS aminotransferase family protein [Nitrosomonadales bacterium]|nr:DegT/DnrJ/EryC1/StrS aminotransferase family protein [Nitrosomonadales bacterium]